MKNTNHPITLAILFRLLLGVCAIVRTPLPARATPSPSPTGQVLTGIDVLIETNFAALRGRRVGLITNQTGRARDGRSTIDVLHHAPGVKLVALFGPEHGVRGTAAAGRHVKTTRDAKTGLPVYSLYGATRTPTAAMLRGLDTLVFDIQDIGARSYTFIATMGNAMEAAAAHHKRFVVLDRPNPLGGVQIEGNITEAKYRSFVSPYPIPYRHGLTVGELAWMLNGRGWLKHRKACDLSVIKMRHYRRTMYWADTGLHWVRTSPNVPTVESAFGYAATGIAGELGALSIGVGTSDPFQLAGAPGLNATALLRELQSRHLPGFAFQTATWKPARGAYRGHTVTGVRFTVTDPQKAQLTRLNFALMDAARKIAPHLPFFRSRSHRRMFDLVCGTGDVRRLFQAGQPATTLWWAWNKNNSGFANLRRRYLLYS